MHAEVLYYDALIVLGGGRVAKLTSPFSLDVEVSQTHGLGERRGQGLVPS